MKAYIKGVMDNGKGLKCKLRSGTNALGQETKMWGRGEGKCESCSMDVIEDVEHFVMHCSKHKIKEGKYVFLK